MTQYEDLTDMTLSHSNKSARLRRLRQNIMRRKLSGKLSGDRIAPELHRWLDRLKSYRRPGESYSDVILRVAAETEP
jgi:hypothetical protein